MIKAMDNYLVTGRRHACDIIWEDRLIYDLVKRIYRKTKERKAREENEEAIRRRNLNVQMFKTDTVENTNNQSVHVFETDTKTQLENTNNQMTAGTISTSQINMEVPQTSLLIDAIDNLYNEQIQKIEHNARKLMEWSRETIDTKYREFRDLTGKISHHQNELRKLIEAANDKLEKSKDFN